ncbi:PREDICTED: uncharacterized protein LOC108364439 isoform X2 [Rhagoletis zephyria]|uniref:uncharacterized protein LOC108364439 isoform X2 n=1 Tax=Rhagoletis zephyria TaxID=28612 RepID=UPI0008115402|nr:PREDICTED: uncharacterized protein LOC108364439 isoform X2 [Rhagoletis zephyria]
MWYIDVVVVVVVAVIVVVVVVAGAEQNRFQSCRLAVRSDDIGWTRTTMVSVSVAEARNLPNCIYYSRAAVGSQKCCVLFVLFLFLVWLSARQLLLRKGICAIMANKVGAQQVKWPAEINTYTQRQGRRIKSLHAMEDAERKRRSRLPFPIYFSN